MRYATARNMDISNGENLGVSLFVQGCHRHCYNCFNPETWNFNNGKEWTSNTKNALIKLISKPYINRLSILGGEPLDPENIDGVKDLVISTYTTFPNKKIWLYTGYTWECIMGNPEQLSVIRYCDVLVDGEYIDALKDMNLKFRGSSNQRVIDIQKSLTNDKIVSY